MQTIARPLPIPSKARNMTRRTKRAVMAPSEADAALAVAAIKALLPIVRRNPSLAASPTQASVKRARLALVPLFGGYTLAGAIEAHLALWRFLNSEHGDKPAEDTPQDVAAFNAWYALGDFAKSAPAATPDDAAARARFLAWNEANGGALDSGGWQQIMEAIAGDFARLTHGAPIPDAATFAGWCAR